MPLPLFRRQLSPLRSFSASLALIALTGCETDERSPRRGPPPSEPGASAPAPAPEMSAHATFFSGQIETEILLSRLGFGPRGNAKDGAPPAGSEGRSRGGFGGGGPRGGGGSPGRGSGGRGSAEPGESRGTPGRNADGAPVPHIVASNRPPLRLHLRLTNHASNPVDIEVLDFNSDLGNFVVQPRKLTLAAGASVEAEPMTSRIGLTADAIPVTVRLRRTGQTEQQKLILQIIAPSATPPAAPPPAP